MHTGSRSYFCGFSLRALRLCGVFLCLSLSVLSQGLPAPKDVLGFTPGDDRKLASWTRIVDYFKKLDAASDRVKFEEIGKSTMGAPFVYATISSPENLLNLEKYKRINAQLADPRTFKSNDAVAKRLIKQGKTIVLITCGIHSTEVGSTLSSTLIAHQLALANHPDIRKVLDNTIILLVPSLNPDGVDIVKNWYDKTLGTKFEGTEPPELYHKYVGHDNNRDWYAFTQVETQLTVDKIHNVWHPQVVHDIHQQGANGARIFLPPYMQPVEPNVPKQIVEGYTELGNQIAGTLRQMGMQGITTNSTYDAWTPARAYSHYHGGVRILSETASAKLATPITLKLEDLRGSEGYDARKQSDNFGPVWLGGEWNMRKITDYMTAAAHMLLNHVAADREKWLTRFYQIGKAAVRPKGRGEPVALSIKPASRHIREILERAQVEVRRVKLKGESEESLIVRTDQPYFAFAKALLEPQKYPDLRDPAGAPIAPYDVTAHSLSLLQGLVVSPVFSENAIPQPSNRFGKLGPMPPMGPKTCKSIGLGIYRSEIPSMDEGWTRFVTSQRDFERLGTTQNGCVALGVGQRRNADILTGRLHDTAIIFPDQSANQILNGYAKGSMPDDYTGGVGKEGVENLKKYVEAGGTLVFLNRASNFAIREFNLPIRDVTAGLSRKDFYIPGSILRTELDTSHPIAKGTPQQSIAWFENSPAFEVQTDPLALTNNFRIIARYPSDPKQILLSGWALGAEKIAGKAALIEWKMGKGKILLFGFRPQYRGQSLTTLPLLFNAISN
jgi:hypothetical protein